MSPTTEKGVIKIDGKSTSIAERYDTVRGRVTDLIGDLRSRLRRLVVTVAPAHYYARYKASVAAELAHLDVPGRERPLDLGDIYVPLRLVQHGLREAPGESAGAQLEPRQTALKGPRRTAPTSIQDALLQSPRIAALGSPGSGKTTLLQYLGLAFARGDVDSEYVRRLTFTHQDEPLESLVPILVSLPDLAESGADLAPHLVRLFAEHAFPYADAFLHRRLNDGQCLLLLDGLDRIADEGRRQTVIDQIDALEMEFARTNPVLVSSRLVGYSHDLKGFAHLELVPFDHEDVERFVSNRFTEQPARGDDLLAVLERSPRMQSMAANPLLLSTLAVAREGLTQPHARSVDLYEACVRILLREEPDDALEQCAQRVAYDFHCRKQPRFSKEDLSAVIGEAISDSGDGRDKVEDLLAGLTERTALLLPVSETSYAFAHPALRECLAAQEVFAVEGVSGVMDRIDDPWWHEVIVLFSGLQRDASDLVEAILARGEETGAEAVLLAARCLHDADRTGEDLRRKVRARLFEIFERDAPPLWPRAAAAIAGLEGERAARTFGDFLRSDDPHLRRGAASALGRMRAQWGVAPLIAALGDRAPQVRGRAAWALGLLGDKRAVHPLIKLLDDDSADVRREAIEALGAIGEPALDPLIGALAGGSGEVPMRAARALSRVGQAAVPALLSALVSEKGEVRDGVVVALAEIGAPAVEPLIAALGSRRSQIRCGALAALGRIGDPEAMGFIIDALDDAEPVVRQQAVRTLVEMGGPAVLPLVPPLTDKRRKVSEGTYTALVEIGQRAIDGLMQSLGEERRATRWAVVRVLGAIGSRHPEVVARLTEALKDERQVVRQSAVKALAQVGSDSAIEVLVEVLQTDEEAVRREATDGLLGLASDRVVKELREALDRGAHPDRVIDMAGRIGSRPALDFLRELLDSEDRSIRRKAAIALETDETSGLYYYRAWEERIEEYLYEHGIFTTAMLVDTPAQLRAVVLQRYVNSHPQTDLTFNAETGVLGLKAFSSVRRIIEYWNRASQNVGDEVELSGQMFNECVTSLTNELCDILDVTTTGAESDGRLYAFALDVSSVTERTNLPRAVPLVFLRRQALEESDLDRLRALLPKMNIFHRTALLILFGQGEQLSQARQLLDERLRDVHAFDVVVLGRRDIQHIVTAKDTQEALRFTICAQADLTLVSPYSFDEPASSELFFGREFEIRSITQAIDNSSVAVMGGRRIGKTSILRRVADLLCELHACHYLDCHPIRDYEILFRTLPHRWPNVGRHAPEPVSFHSVVSELRTDGPLILVLDEIDALLRFDIENDELLFKTFRSLSQEGQCRFIFSGERVLSNQLKYGSAGPLFNFCGQRIRLGYLEPKSAEQLIVEPMEWMNIDLRERERVVEGILDLSSCHPRLVQYICHSLIEQINQEGVRFITSQHLQRIAGSNEFRDEYLWTVWGDATPFEKALTLALEETSATQDDIQAALARWHIPYTWEDLKAALHNLELCSILERDNDTFRFVAEHFPEIARESLDIEMEINSWRRQIIRERDL